MAGVSPESPTRVVRTLETAGFAVSERVHERYWTLPSHAHENTIMGIVLTGSYVETINRHERVCGPDSLQLLPSGQRHVYRFGDERVRCLTIEIKPHRFQEICRFSSMDARRLHVSGKAVTGLLRRLYRQFRDPDPLAPLVVEGIVFEILAAIAAESEGVTHKCPPAWLLDARDRIHDGNLAGVSLSSLGSAVDVHPAHLDRVFRRHFGCSVSEYVGRLRIDRAAHELACTNRPLAEIALETGFCDQSHFTRMFKRRIQMTPGQFRKSLRPSG